MQIIVPELSDKQTRDLDRILRYALDADQMRRFNFEHRQRQIAAVNERLAPERYGPLGEQLLEVDADVFFAWDVMRNGCWGDKTFIREFVRDNDACRAKRPPRRIFNGF